MSQKKGRRYSAAVPKRLRCVKPDGTLAVFFIPTDVEKKPRTLKALAVRGGDAITGTTLGAVGLVFNGDDGQSYILTNAHVTPGLDQVAQSQPVRILGGPIIGRTFGRHYYLPRLAKCIRSMRPLLSPVSRWIRGLLTDIKVR